MKYLIVFISILLLRGNLFAQQAEIIWIKPLNVPQSELQYTVNGGTATSDGNFILAGACRNMPWTGFCDNFIMKVDRNGDTLWSRQLGQYDYHEAALDAIETYDGNIAIVGIVQFEDSFSKVRLYKMDTHGSQIWEKTYYGTYYMFGRGITETSDSGLAITGEHAIDRGNMYILKTNSDGDSLWLTSYGGQNQDYAQKVAPTVDGGAIMVGCYSSESANYDSLCVVRLDSSGDIVWLVNFPPVTGEDFKIPHIIRNSDGTYIIAVAAGESSIHLFKLREDGTTVWTTTVGNINGFYEVFDICEGYNNDIFLTGYYASSMYVIKINQSADSLWSIVYYDVGMYSGYFVHQAGNGDIYVAGQIYYNKKTSIFFMKIREATTDIENHNMIPLQTNCSLAQNYPNPFNAGTQIDFVLKSRGHVIIDIFNSLGQKVNTILNGEKPAGNYSVSWDGTDAPGHRVASGMYYYRISVDGFVESRKMMLLK